MRARKESPKPSNAKPRNRLGILVGSPAFLAQLSSRFEGSKYRPRVFADSEQEQGDRWVAAFSELLLEPGDRAVIIGSDCPDVPLPFLKRAFQVLKHRDLVIGPSFEGGCYLIGLRRNAPGLFRNIHWGSATVLEEMLDAIERERMTLALVPPWHRVHDAESLRAFETLNRARRMAGK